MADVKISALPIATTPLAGTEVLPIVQSATTDQVSVANLTAGRAVSAASLTLTTTPLAAGSGGTGLTSLGTGVATALGNAVNGASGLCVQDASGNLGLGVTPSAWGSGYKILELGRAGTSLFSNASNGNLGLFGNVYVDTSLTSRYANNGFAVQFLATNTNGGFAWNIAPSGIAGNAITFTQAMTLDASGNLLVATATNHNTRVAIKSSGTNQHLVFEQENSSADGWGIRNYGGGGGNLEFSRMTSTTTFTPAMTLDTSGNLLVGTTSAVLAGKITVQYNGASARGISLDNTYNGTVNAVSCSYNGAYVGGLTSSATATALVTSSDVRLKENIVDAASALESIISMPIRQFDWKVDGSHTNYGVVAQEAYEYAPEMVTQGDLWSVDYGRITPRLIKAFQELAAKVEALEAKVA
jgi:hypothetical protein